MFCAGLGSVRKQNLETTSSFFLLVYHLNLITLKPTHFRYIQGVPGVMNKTSGE